MSVGEWQRIAQARAFLRQAPIILLIEPTSAMDPWAEADRLRRFRELGGNRTAIIITHRFTTAAVADVVQQFVLLILQERWDPSAILEKRDLLARYSMDWEKCYQLIAANDVAPLVYSIIHDQRIFPPEFEQILHNAHENNRVRNIYLFSELKTILRRFEVVWYPKNTSERLCII